MMPCDEKMDEIWELLAKTNAPKLDNIEEVREYTAAITKLIYDYKMIGLIYGLYTADVEYHKQSGIEMHTPDEIARQITEFTAEFPNLTAEIQNIIVHQESPEFYKVWRRCLLRGNNLRFSPQGPATGKSLGEHCLNLTMFYLRKINGEWKITFEVNSDCESLISEAKRGEAEA
ncbi:MAG: nuclear transport factor 2 family protein [Eubacteriales bacterium]|nr:nuclear transport factor 2 family protein [Eubacteriales bacterium]